MHIDDAAIKKPASEERDRKPSVIPSYVSIDRVGETMCNNNDAMRARFFTTGEVERIRRHISTARQKAMYFYDLRLEEHSWLTLWNPDELITINLTSRNLGYDFALQKRVTQTGYGPPFALEIDIYISPCGKRNYTFHKKTASLSDALKEVDSIYNTTADYHLP